MWANFCVRGVYDQLTGGAESCSASLTGGCVGLIDALASLADYIAGHELFSIKRSLEILY
jgi:hypothetical protein